MKSLLIADGRTLVELEHSLTMHAFGDRDADCAAIYARLTSPRGHELPFRLRLDNEREVETLITLLDSAINVNMDKPESRDRAERERVLEDVHRRALALRAAEPEAEWEVVHTPASSSEPQLKRIAVPGGWLYINDKTPNMTFVPDPRLNGGKAS